MSFDFENDYGVNAGYVQALYDEWRGEPGSVDESWKRLFERLELREGKTGARVGAAAAPAPARKAKAAAPEAVSAQPEAGGDELELLTGVPGLVAVNMTESLELPTATSVRTMPAKLLSENRRILNEHMQLRAFGKASFTHLIAFALVHTLREMPGVQSAFEERNGRRYRRRPGSVNLGLAIDVPSRSGRALVVPNIKDAQELGFLEFYRAYEDIVRRGRAGKLPTEDFQRTTVTLTNPGGFGTTLSVPRLMKGQGLIVASGAIRVPPELAGMSPARESSCRKATPSSKDRKSTDP